MCCIIIFVYCPWFPTPGVGRDMSCLHCFLSYATSSVMFNFLMSSSRSSLVYLLAFYLTFLALDIVLLSMLFSSLRFTRPNHLNLIFLNLCSRFSILHLVFGLSFVRGDNDCRKTKEMRLIDRLGTLNPNGMNERFTFF